MKAKRALLYAGLPATLAVATALAVFHVRSTTVEPPSAPLSHEIYIWQRHWDAGLTESVHRAAPQVSQFTVLAAEVSWTGSSPSVVRVPVDWQVLRDAGKPVGIALRVGSFRGPFDRESDEARGLAALAGSLIAQARSGGVEPAELQVDFDCPESKLDGYREWAMSLRSAVRPVPLTLTVLPCWLKHAEFSRLVRAADGFVLQVHSLERPASFDRSMCLCDTDRARRWALDAAKFGVPFRVALPTCGYLVAFTPDDRFVGISAEGPAPAWPADTRIRAVRSDPGTLAGLVETWRLERPVMLRAITWYRLPVDGDRLNWSWTTLSTVMSGRVPRESLDVEVAWPEPNLAEIVLVNSGQADVAAARGVRVEWKKPDLLAADGLRGFSVSGKDERTALLTRSADEGLSLLAPGDRWKIGWLRFKTAAEVRACVTSTQPQHR